MRRADTVLSLGTSATDSLVERFGTFTIIVLGEVVLGVVAGLVPAERDGMTIAVGLLALCIGFGLWWIYFDLVGRRLPRNGPPLTNWVLSHFPIALRESPGSGDACSPAWGQRWQLPNQPQPIGDPP